jgi:hypothetical protein
MACQSWKISEIFAGAVSANQVVWCMSINHPSNGDHEADPYKAPSDDVLFHQSYQAKSPVGGSVTSTKSLYVVSLVVIWLMMIGVLAGIAFLLSTGTAGLLTPFDRSEPPRSLLPYLAIKAGGSILLILHIVLYCVWKRRSMRNAWIMAENVGTKPSISPGWSIGYYFIPIAMWFMPYKAMKEIWQTSVPERGSTLLFLWWTAWVLHQITEQIINVIGPVSGFVIVIGDVLFLTAGIALTRIMSSVTKAQRDQGVRLAADGNA